MLFLINILPGDIYIKSRELHFNNDATRVVFIIRVAQQTDISVYDVIQNFFLIKQRISLSMSMKMILLLLKRFALMLK